MWGPCARTKERPIGAKGSLQLTASKEQDLLVYSCKELDFGNNLNVLEIKFFPKSPNKSPVCQHLDFSLLKIEQLKQSKQPRLLTYTPVT